MKNWFINQWRSTLTYFDLQKSEKRSPPVLVVVVAMLSALIIIWLLLVWN